MWRLKHPQNVQELSNSLVWQKKTHNLQQHQHMFTWNSLSLLTLQKNNKLLGIAKIKKQTNQPEPSPKLEQVAFQKDLVLMK
jgi:hypothetical protein